MFFFLSNSEVYTKSPPEFFIWSICLNCSNSVNHNQVQGLSRSKYSLLGLPFGGIEPATSRWFHLEAPSNQTSYPLRHVFLPYNSEWIFGTYKRNVSITFLFTIAHKAFFLKISQIFFLWGYSKRWQVKQIAPDLNRGMSSNFFGGRGAEKCKPCKICRRMCDVYEGACFNPPPKSLQMSYIKVYGNKFDSKRQSM